MNLALFGLFLFLTTTAGLLVAWSIIRGGKDDIDRLDIELTHSRDSEALHLKDGKVYKFEKDAVIVDTYGGKDE